MKFKSIHVDHTFYPVKYRGSFESSDAELNRIWETGAYTAHLCMQDGLWDASKRDRGRWSGDNDVSGRVVDDVFGDHYLMEDTMDRLIGEAPVTQHVNGIPGYSSYWFTQVAEYYRHTGSKEFLTRTHDRAVQLLEHIDAEFDEPRLICEQDQCVVVCRLVAGVEWRYFGVAAGRVSLNFTGLIARARGYCAKRAIQPMRISTSSGRRLLKRRRINIYSIRRRELMGLDGRPMRWPC